eukprot:gene15710-21820_t
MDAVPQSVCSIFVKGLNKNTATSMLMSVFSRFGSVIQCQIARHRSGRSAGFAIVTYAKHEEAALALQSVDNSQFLGRRLNVRWYQPERDSMNAQQIQGMLNYGQEFLAQQMRNAAAAAACSSLAQKQGVYGGADTAPSMPMSDQANMETWLPAAQVVAKEGLGLQEEPVKEANWSAMVGMWLNDYESLPSDRRTTTQSNLSLTPRRRTTNQSLNQDPLVDISAFRLTADSTQEEHDFAGHLFQDKEDPGSFGKSRLATKWGRGSASGGGSVIEEGGCSSNASQMGSDEVSLLSTAPSGTVRAKSDSSMGDDVVLPSSEDISQAMRKVFSLSLSHSQEQEPGSLSGMDVMDRDQQERKDQQVWLPPAAAPKHMAGKPLPPRAPHAKMKQTNDLSMQRKQQAAAAAAMESHANAAMATVSNAQEQYAQALYQLNSARAQIMAAAASIQVPPHALPHAAYPQPDAFMHAAFQQSMMQGMMAGMPPPPPPAYQRQHMSRTGY